MVVCETALGMNLCVFLRGNLAPHLVLSVLLPFVQIPGPPYANAVPFADDRKDV